MNQKRRILIVADDCVNPQDIASEALREAPGAEVTVVRSSAPWRDALERGPYDLVVGDTAVVRSHWAQILSSAGREQAPAPADDRRLSQAQRMEVVGELAGGVAHQFNNLLTTILGYGRILLDRLPADDPNRADIGEIYTSGERAAALTRQLLAFSRRQILEPSVVDVNAIVVNLESALAHLMSEKVDVVMQLGTGIPAVKADAAQLEQALVSLAANARDAMPSGGTLRITTSVVDVDDRAANRYVGLRPGRHVCIAVADSGVGISPEILPRVFEPFFTTKPVGQGTGLGLSAVYGTVKQSGGYVYVESAPNSGSVFTIYMPALDVPVPDQVSVNAEVPDQRPGTETVLLVEDEAGVREVMRRILERHGYTVISVEDATAALEAVRRYPGPVHVLVTDVVMPGRQGPELARELTQLKPELAVLFVSGYADRLDDVPGLTEPSGAILQKPFSPEALVRAVREVVEARSPRTASRG